MLNLYFYPNENQVSFNTCQSCLAWPASNDDANEDLDDQFDFYHQYDSKFCSAAQHYKQKCGWGCKRRVKKGSASNTSSAAMKHAWNGFEKFCLVFWSFCGESAQFIFDMQIMRNLPLYSHHVILPWPSLFVAIGLTWIVLKQRRHMSREDAIVEEAAMQGVGLKKRHIFPIALAIIFFTIFSMFMVWKKMTWLLLIGANFGLFAHFMYLRRKAKRANAGMQGYVKDGGLEIN